MINQRQFHSPIWKPRTAYLLLVPGLLLFTFFFLYPILFSIHLSTTNASFFNFVRGPVSIGLENYRKLIIGGKFVPPLLRTILFIATSVPLKIIAGLFLASMLNSPLLRFKRVLRPLFLTPWAIPWFFLVLIWRGMFNQDFGVINQAIQSFGITPLNWLNHTSNAFLAYNVVEVYLSFPFMMTVAFAAIQSIPSELYESAVTDGAGTWSLFFNITVPMIIKPLLWATLMTTIASYLIFGVPFLLNGGGPTGSNEFLLVFGYKNAFVLGRYGFAAAFMILVFTLLLCLVILFSRLTRLTDEE